MAIHDTAMVEDSTVGDADIREYVTLLDAEIGDDVYEEVVLEPGAFVGSGAVVLPGVTVGGNAVVGAGTTVVEDVPAGQLVRGGATNVTREL
jgi:acetyltransferase-like isoleucine patch superfamily enzyme